MSAVGAPTHPDAGKPRADFCVSDLRGETAAHAAMELIVETLKSYGYSVSVNTRTSETSSSSRIANPTRRIDSIQVEINKKLFMDTQTFRATDGLTKVRVDLDRLLRTVAKEMVRLARVSPA